jgi:uncharacterized protein YutE (UPF0331/DUF86 family)/predicted nucleotidyltransferase
VDTAAVEARRRTFFEADPRGAIAVYVFGSVGRGEARSDSDLDLGVLFAADPPATLDTPSLGLEGELERLLRVPVEVVALNRAHADLVHRVLRDGRLILDRDRAARIRFEVRSRNQYFDMAEIRRRYRRYPPGVPATKRGCGREAMTDPELIAKRLAFIETCVRELRTLARPDRIADDVREQRFVEHTLQLAIRAALDVGSHVVSDERLGEPETSRDVFRLLEGAGVVDSELGERLERMAGFRNVVVHLYQEVDLGIVRDVVENHLDDLLRFSDAIRRRL